jgi:prepilin-type N-terminal cleavage/methylation domain-containing protein
MKRADDNAGFTLIEVMVALAILGVTAMVLLDTHYGALRLFNDTREEVLMQELVERALGQAENEVLAGQLSGSGSFGKRYPECTFAYSAQQMGSEQGIPLYEVTVTVAGPVESRTMMMAVFNVGQL